jgi:hypothetical protein
MSIADKLVTVAENVPKVYEAGKKSEYDAFWDAYQQNGERVNYHTGFAGQGWNEHTFKPKYDIKPTNAYMMFYQIPTNANIDLVKVAEEQGVVFDFSNCTNFHYVFYSSGIVRVGVIDTRRFNSFSQFAGANNSLHTIEKLILKDDGSQTISNASWFLPNSIVNITIEGKLGYTARSSSSNMTKASIESFINALYEGSEGQTLTLSRTAVGKAFQSSEGAYDGISSDEWKALVESKPNWTISLV